VIDHTCLKLCHVRRANQRITLFEVSDHFLDIQPWSPVFRVYENPENRAILIATAQSADARQFSSVFLRQTFAWLGLPGPVFPNMVTRVGEYTKRAPDAPIAIGWGGSHGHLVDMQSIARPLIHWMKRRGAANDGLPAPRLSIMASRPIRALFQACPHVELLDPGDLDHYLGFVARLHIGIAPLNPTGFNRGRSDIKFLEYASCGVASVLQDIEPYWEAARDGTTALFFSSPASLIARLDELRKTPALLEKIRSNAHQYALSKRRQVDHVSERLEFMRTVAAETGAAPWRGPCGTRGPGFFDCTRDAFSVRLFEGVVGDERAAFEALREAKQLCPAHYLPWLIESSRAENKDKARWLLEEACRRDPDALLPAIVLAEHEATHAEAREGGRRRAAALAERHPYYARAHVLLGRLAESADEACAHFERAHAAGG